MDHEKLLLAAQAVQVSIILAAAVRLKKKKQRKPRQCWIKPWLLNRGEKALRALADDLSGDIQINHFLRMSERAFEDLLQMISPAISKRDTVMRNAITPRDRLLVTLRFLGSGQSYGDLQYDARIPACTLSQIIPETCDAIYQALRKDHLEVPSTKDQWLQIARDFSETWNVENCLGALDGKLIKIHPPPREGATYWCYKGFNAIILLALVDAKSRFIYVDVGANGRAGDAAVYARSPLKRCLVNRSLKDMPTSDFLTGTRTDAPYVVLADDAFPLSMHLLKPYPLRGISRDEATFNYRLSRARQTVECAFGMMANKFRLFINTINLNPEKVKTITLAACAIHNFLINMRDEHWARARHEIDPNLQMERLVTQADHGAGRGGPAVRDLYKDYYVSNPI